MAETHKLTGGASLKKALTMIAAKAKNSALLNVGFPEGSTESNGESTPLVAFINEFGKIVRSKDGDYYQMPRPFFRRMIAKESPHWGEDLGKLLVARHYDVVEAFKPLGEEIHGELVASIQTLTSPPLAPSTIKRKGFSKPLINKGDMWRSVSSWVQSED